MNSVGGYFGYVITDALYGTVGISNRILNIIKSPLLGRLKSVHQNGTNFLVDKRQTTTRYEHSIGALALTSILGGEESKQTAALLHDVSHTVFSHVIDLVFANREQNYHDLIRKNFLESPFAKSIITEFSISEQELDCEAVPMVKAKGAKLNVDRIDYCLRDLHTVGLISRRDCLSIVHNLSVDRDGEVKCNSIEAARDIFKRFIQVNQMVYFDPKAESAAVAVSWIMNQMFQKQIISEKHLFVREDQLIAMIQNSAFGKLFEEINPGLPCFAGKGFCPPVLRKLRYVDPCIVGESGKLTDHCEASKKILEEYLKTPKTVHYRIEPLEKFIKDNK